MKPGLVLLAGALLGSGCGASTGKVQSLEAELNQSRGQIATARSQIAALESQLAAANARIAELTPWANQARTLPVRITNLRSGTDTNSTYRIVNLSGSTLAVKIQLSNPTYQHRKSLTCVLPASRPAAPYEIGTADWPAAPGDVMEMTSEGYDVLTKTF